MDLINIGWPYKSTRISKTPFQSRPRTEKILWKGSESRNDWTYTIKLCDCWYQRTSWTIGPSYHEQCRAKTKELPESETRLFFWWFVLAVLNERIQFVWWTLVMESGFKIRCVVVNPHHFSLEPRVGRRSENGGSARSCQLHFMKALVLFEKTRVTRFSIFGSLEDSLAPRSVRSSPFWTWNFRESQNRASPHVFSLASATVGKFLD